MEDGEFANHYQRIYLGQVEGFWGFTRLNPKPYTLSFNQQQWPCSSSSSSITPLATHGHLKKKKQQTNKQNKGGNPAKDLD
jgi:hypothetical protein